MSTTNDTRPAMPLSEVPVTSISCEVLFEDIGRPMSR